MDMRWRCQYSVGGRPLLREEAETSFIKPPLSRGEVVHMVTHSELILIGQLIVSILTLFVHIYNNKKK